MWVKFLNSYIYIIRKTTTFPLKKSLQQINANFWQGATLHTGKSDALGSKQGQPFQLPQVLASYSSHWLIYVPSCSETCRFPPPTLLPMSRESKTQTRVPQLQFSFLQSYKVRVPNRGELSIEMLKLCLEWPASLQEDFLN